MQAFTYLWVTLKVIMEMLYLWAKSIVEFFQQFIFPNYKDISEDVVLVTGAGHGIGQLMCVEFAKHNCKVVALDINSKGLVATSQRVQQVTGRIIATYRCDLSLKQEIYSCAAQIQREVGTVTILVNNAGIVTGKYFLDLEDAEWERTFHVNTFARFYTVKAFLPEMIEKGRGHLVFISSIAGQVSAPRLTDYCASKAADFIFADTLLAELHHQGHSSRVHVTTVAPYMIRTGMFNGCKSSFSHLLPELNPDYVARRIVNAVRRNQQALYIRRRIAVLPVLKSILPTSCLLLLYQYTGCLNMMDSFAGSIISTSPTGLSPALPAADEKLVTAGAAAESD